jgi:HSP20 family protein
MKLVPWKANETHKPALLLEDFDKDIDSLFSSFFGPSRGGGSMASTWAPSLDIKETKEELVVTADLPGMKKEEIQLKVENGTLSLSGERKIEEKKDEEGWHRVERSYGSFYRSIALPQGVDESKVRAEYKDGVLKVSIPKSETAKPKSIQIS